MHYGKYAFGNGKGPTIEPLDKTRRIGQRRGFSKIDIQQINAMYCKDSKFTFHRFHKKSYLRRKIG